MQVQYMSHIWAKHIQHMSELCPTYVQYKVDVFAIVRDIIVRNIL